MRLKRERLMAVHPYCHWCGCALVYYNPGPDLRQSGPLPDNFATVDHVNSRNLSRPRPPLGQLVLACNLCNFERGLAEQQARLDELQRRPAWQDNELSVTIGDLLERRSA
jgi:hypothetical protein